MTSIDPDRKHRRTIYSLLIFVVLGLGGLYLVWSLRVLVLPLIIGTLLAYIFKPLIHQIKIPWLPQWGRALVVLAGLFAVIVFSSQRIQKAFPDKLERLQLQIRVQYKLNEKFNRIMGISQDHPEGNFLYKLGKSDINNAMLKLNNILYLDHDQQEIYFSHYQSLTAPTELEAKVYQYFLSNKKNFSQSAMAKKSPSTKKQESKDDSVVADKKSKSHLLAAVFSTFSNWMLTPFVFIFLLFDNGAILRFLMSLVPNRYFEMSLTVVEQVDLAIGRYLRGTLMECFLVGLTFFVGLFLIGIQPHLAIGIGLIAGFANAIPFLGPAIGLVVGLGYALIAEDISPMIPLIDTDNLYVGVLVVVIVAQLLDNVVFQPIVLGGAVNLHPLVVIIGVMGGATLFDFAGMLLAIPTIVVLNVIVTTAHRELIDYKII